MNIAILGAGNIAWHLSKAFIKAGHPVKQIWSRTAAKAIDLALEIGANSIDDLNKLHNEIDLIVIAVNDESIAEVAALIPYQHQLVVHTSGSTSIKILEAHFSNCGVIYPLQTFSKSADVNFSNVPVCIEGNSITSTEILFHIASKLSPNVHVIDSDKRLMLHISAVFACNFSNHLFAIAQALLEESGMNFNLIKPLIMETAIKAMEIMPAEAQTGPAKRNDQVTVLKHLEMLKERPEWFELYQKISQDIVKMSSKNQASHK